MIGTGERSMIVEKRRNRAVRKQQALAQSLDELSCCFKKHCRLIHADMVMVNGEPGKIYPCNGDCPHRHQFKAVLIDTIKILEGTRKNFKSKQIEALRQKLTETLAKI